MRRTHTHTHLNGAPVVAWAPTLTRAPTAPALTAPGPRCPQHCDVATPPEYGGGDQYVCTCCGTQFTWRPS